MKKTITVLGAMLIVSFILTSCGHEGSKNNNTSKNDSTTTTVDNSKKYPTDDQIIAAIRKQVEKTYDINDWSKKHARCASIKEIKITRKGEYNEEKKYWPVEAYQSVSHFLGSSDDQVLNEFNLPWQIIKNDFGDFVAVSPPAE